MYLINVSQGTRTHGISFPGTRYSISGRHHLVIYFKNILRQRDFFSLPFTFYFVFNFEFKIMESLSELENNDSIISHCIDKRHQCELCDKVLYSYRCLKEQITDVNKEGNLYKCEDCINVIHQKTKLSVHERTNERYKCNNCGKFFSYQSRLKEHIRNVHDGRKDHKCGTCGKSFTSAGYLRMHAAMHTVHQGNRDYKCDSCDKSFYQEGNLKRHIFAVHEGNKNNKCKYCSKSFSRAAYLKKHFHIIHKGYKDHKCETCSKSFSERHHLKRHINAFHLQSDEKCDISINQGLKMEK